MKQFIGPFHSYGQNMINETLRQYLQCVEFDFCLVHGLHEVAIGSQESHVRTCANNGNKSECHQKL